MSTAHMTHVRFPDEHGKPAAMCGAAMVSDHQAVDPVVVHGMGDSDAVCLACLQMLSE